MSEVLYAPGGGRGASGGDEERANDGAGTIAAPPWPTTTPTGVAAGPSRGGRGIIGCFAAIFEKCQYV